MAGTEHAKKNEPNILPKKKKKKKKTTFLVSRPSPEQQQLQRSDAKMHISHSIMISNTSTGSISPCMEQEGS
jgi:hypothetical protein